MVYLVTTVFYGLKMKTCQTTRRVISELKSNFSEVALSPSAIISPKLRTYIPDSHGWPTSKKRCFTTSVPVKGSSLRLLRMLTRNLKNFRQYEFVCCIRLCYELTAVYSPNTAECWNHHAVNRVVFFRCSAVTISNVELHLFASDVELNKSIATGCLGV